MTYMKPIPSLTHLLVAAVVVAIAAVLSCLVAYLQGRHLRHGRRGGRAIRGHDICQSQNGSGGFNYSGFGTVFVVTVEMVYGFIETFQNLCHRGTPGRPRMIRLMIREQLLDGRISSEHGGEAVVEVESAYNTGEDV